MSRSPRRALVLVVATALAVSALVAAPAASASTAESVFVTKINAARAAAGLPAVSVSGDLVAVARQHSSAMAGRKALYHSSLSGICCFTSLAENVGSGATTAAVHAAFMGSSGHRANILNPAMRHVGVGVVSSGGQLWVTEIFRAPVKGFAAVPTTHEEEVGVTRVAEHSPAGTVAGRGPEDPDGPALPPPSAAKPRRPCHRPGVVERHA